LFGSVAKHVETTFCMTHRESMLKDSGLVQAMQYGIDRYPAIVFDGKAVVYGITDVRAATQRYQQWQAGRLDHDARYPPSWIHPADVGAPHEPCWNHLHHGNRFPDHECRAQLYALDADGDVLLAALFHL
jgi:hypothetical protein